MGLALLPTILVTKLTANQIYVSGNILEQKKCGISNEIYSLKEKDTYYWYYFVYMLYLYTYDTAHKSEGVKKIYITFAFLMC